MPTALLRAFIDNAKNDALALKPPDTDPVDVPETKAMAQRMLARHDTKAVEAATLVVLTETLLKEHGMRRGINLDALIALQHQVAGAWLESEGVDPKALNAALASYGRAGNIVRYLSAMPA
jgi:hypothetical protein